jgi:hypothetical protein
MMLGPEYRVQISYRRVAWSWQINITDHSNDLRWRIIFAAGAPTAIERFIGRQRPDHYLMIHTGTSVRKNGRLWQISSCTYLVMRRRKPRV